MESKNGYRFEHGGKIRLAIIFPLIILIFFQVGCWGFFGREDGPKVCRDFFSKSRTDKEFLNHSLEDQFEIHKCSLQHIPGIGREGVMSEGGEKIVPFLVEKLNGKYKSQYEKDLTVYATAEVFSSLSIKGYLHKRGRIVDLLERKVRLIEDGIWRDRAMDDLRTIKEELNR